MNRFNFSCWTYFKLSKATDTLVKDYYELGLNLPISPIFDDGEDFEKMIRLLDEFHEYDMRVILYDDRVVAHRCKGMDDETYRLRFKKSLEQFGSHPAVFGFYVGDEPDAPDASFYFKIASIQREMAPNLCPYLNLLPWFDWIAKRIGSPAYAPYLDRAVEEGNLKLLSYDCYTQMHDGDREKNYNIYFNNLRSMRDASNKHNIPFCSTVLSCGHYDYECPNQDDYRWQISTAAALGAKMISYFYVQTTTISDNYRGFPINFFGERTQSYQWLSEENRFFSLRFSELLPKLTCQKSEFTLKNYGGLELFKSDETLLKASNWKNINMLISTFTDNDGVKYRAVVNMDRKISIGAVLTFAPNVRVEQWIYTQEWKERVGYTDAVGALISDNSSFTVFLAPGQIEIVREIPIA